MELDVKTEKEISKYLKDNDLKLEMVEDENLIYFKLIKDTEPIMYSRPILKYIQELDKEIRFHLKEGICLTESQIPLHNYGKIRNNLVTKVELEEREQFSRRMFSGMCKGRPITEICFGDSELGWLKMQLQLLSDKGYLENRINDIENKAKRIHLQNIIENIRETRRMISLGELQCDKGKGETFETFERRIEWIGTNLYQINSRRYLKKYIKEWKKLLKG